MRTEVDYESVTHEVAGGFPTAALAAERMRALIAEQFEANKEWWEYEEDETAVVAAYEEWIEENFQDEETHEWSYTDVDDGIEYQYRICQASLEADVELSEVYAVVSSHVTGECNYSIVRGLYVSEQEAAAEAVRLQEIYDAEAEDEEFQVEHFASSELVKIEKA